ncbi:MAG: GNAT family N-acetyltransferase [Pseudomonadota bacterium]
MQKQDAVRHALVEDIKPLTATLARAFADDGMIDWLCGPRGAVPDGIRDACAAALFEGYLRCLSLPHGMVYTTHDHSGGALWSPPGKWQMGVAAQLRMTPYFLRATGWKRLPTRFLAAQKILAAHPRAPHYYLQVLGVDPSAQGHGWGTQLLKKGLQVADAAGMPCYLETMNETNIPFYQRHGFRLTGSLRLPWSGHGVWFMWRDAAEPD